MTNVRAAIACTLFASVVAGCAASAVPNSAIAPNPAPAWSRSAMQSPLPGPGCFKRTYPETSWTRIACVAPPNIAFPRVRSAAHASNVGNGDDYTLVSLPLTISGAVGSFPNVHGVTSVRSVGYSGTNVYSLQLNSNNFSTAACAGMAHCVGWEQFVYTNQPNAYSGGGNLIIQDWILSSNSQPIAGCPPGAGWQKSGSSGCYQNGPYAVLVPNVSITQLNEVTLSGSASPRGDGAFFAVGATVYGMRNAQGDGILGLSKHWTGAEFNVFGNGGGSKAVFNSGATITVSLEANTGTATKPDCRANSGTTGESNNLSFIAPPTNPARRRYPSIQFTESNAGGGGSPGCDELSAR